jgi:hypothetical protein
MDHIHFFPHLVHGFRPLRIDVDILDVVTVRGKSIFNKCAMGCGPNQHETENDLLCMHSLRLVTWTAHEADT